MHGQAEDPGGAIFADREIPLPIESMRNTAWKEISPFILPAQENLKMPAIRLEL
jgi:hypothetical protein